MKLLVETPPGYDAERRYALDVLLGEFLGLEYAHRTAARGDVAIRVADADDGRTLRLADGLFRTPEDRWLTAGAMPRLPLARWPTDRFPEGLALDEDLPILFGESCAGGTYCEHGSTQIKLGVDLLGGAFFLLSRYEEIVLPERDAHERFPAAASIAYREGFLDRPLVNEYLALLRWALRALWPDLAFRQREYRVLLSHDVDEPWGAAGQTLGTRARDAIADLLLRADPLTALRRFSPALYDTFGFLMDESERRGLTSAFYFLAGASEPGIEGHYEIGDERIRALLREIDRRGHEIGLHPSYHTFRDADRLRRELAALDKVCRQEGLPRPPRGGRQHYLRWENPTTWRLWEDAGLDYDSTLTFADHAGFRCGVCYEYPVFDLRARQRLTLRERPLVVMEGSLLQYQRLSWPETAATIARLSDVCRRHRGDFTLLWHNSMLISGRQKRRYARILDRIAGR